MQRSQELPLPQPHSLPAETPEELFALDQILTEFRPQLTFLEYRALCAEVVETGTYGRPEYYGNHTDYAYKCVSIPRLFVYMKTKEWL